MIPETVPVLSSDDILVDDNEFWNSEQTKASPIGWCKLLFLMPQVEHEVFLPASDSDRKDYNAAIKALKEAAGLGVKADMLDLIEWEEKATLTAQARNFNKAMKLLGYTNEFYPS